MGQQRIPSSIYRTKNTASLTRLARCLTFLVINTRRHVCVYGENFAISILHPFLDHIYSMTNGISQGVFARYSIVRGTIIRGPALRSICLAESRRSLCSPPCHPKLVLFRLRHFGQNSLSMRRRVPHTKPQ